MKIVDVTGAEGMQRRVKRAALQVLLLVVLVPAGIVAGWYAVSPSAGELAARAAQGADSIALLELVQRAERDSVSAEALTRLVGEDAAVMHELASLSTGHEEALDYLISVARYQPETLALISDLEMSYAFALAILQRMDAAGIPTLEQYAAIHSNAAFVLGVAYENGCHVPQDWELAARWYGLAHDAGYAPAGAYYAPAAYEAGLASHTMESAAYWFAEAAECGHAAAQCALGVCYAETGDLINAVSWYTKAAEQGMSDAQYNLGWCYLYGEGVEADATESVRWFYLAAEQGDDLAQYYVGRAYELGEGVSQDYAEAVRWYCWAVEQGNAAAQCALGHCYAQGRGVEQDWSRAVYFYQLSAEQERTEAMLALSHCYEQGLGVAQDAAWAQHWRQRAAKILQQQPNPS